ncbi:hypothetical protein [Nocardioides sp.]|uniref:hypothetical protein n=1 Tax=Nocardioides sp. TaxID=35761 RepID=UPI002630E08D|nr:hypothetical protein [Nocardioides sp.]
MIGTVGSHFFIDETKAESYVVVAALVPDASLNPARRTVTRMVLPGQRSIHMKHENARRREQIARAMCELTELGVQATIFDAGRGPAPEVVRRERALRALVGRASAEPTASLVLDLDQTLLARDARILSEAIREARSPSLTYSHQLLAAQPLLSIPDVIAWSWARGGDWRRRVDPLISAVIQV